MFYFLKNLAIDLTQVSAVSSDVEKIFFLFKSGKCVEHYYDEEDPESEGHKNKIPEHFEDIKIVLRNCRI